MASHHELEANYERIEVELPGNWPSCPRCGSTERAAMATMKHRKIVFLCAGPNADTLRWDHGDATPGSWMPHELFLPGGRFDGLIPASFLGTPKSTSVDRRLEVWERRKDWIQNEQAACASCRIPPMLGSHDRHKLLTWLAEHHRDLLELVMTFVNEQTPKPTLSTWFDALNEAHRAELIGTIRERVRTSYLTADLGVPRDVLAMLWTNWDPEMRKVARGAMAFGFCRACNMGRGKRIPTRGEILRRHIDLNYAGSEQAARAAAQTWAPLMRVIDALEAHRAAHVSDARASGAV